jgi:hypothetical protein
MYSAFVFVSTKFVFFKLCVSEDGMTVWAFGDGQYGKLGLGHCSSKGIPQVAFFP